MDFVFVTSDIKVTAPITVEDSIKQILRQIGFTTEEQRNKIYDDSINYFSDIRMFTEKDIYDLSADFMEGLRLMGIYTLVCAEQKR